MARDPASWRRVLVVTKFRYLGDTIVATPFLRRLREAAPAAEITLLAGPAIPALLQGCPYLADVWTLVPQGVRGMRDSAATAARARGSRFDAAFLLNRSLHSAFLAAAARIPERIGFDTERRGPLLTVRVPYRREARESDCCLDLLRAVGVEAVDGPPALWVTDDERAAARRLVDEAPGPAGAPVVVVQPGAKDAYKKQWAAERFAAVMDGLAAARPCRFVLVGARDESAACTAVQSAACTPTANLAGRTGLREILGVLAEGSLLLANDTALVHAAAALGTVTVSVQGPQTAAKWGHGPPHRVVWAGTGGAADRHANRRALDDLPPGPVLAAALDALKEIAPWPPETLPGRA